MIVYNVARCWFAEKVPAETYRKSLGLKPTATIKVEIGSRDDLAALLNALCTPPVKGVAFPPPATEALVDAAFVMPTVDPKAVIPQFLIREQEEREALHKRVRRLKGRSREEQQAIDELSAMHAGDCPVERSR